MISATKRQTVKSLNGLAGRFLTMCFMAHFKITQFVCLLKSCLTKSLKKMTKRLKTILNQLGQKMTKIHYLIRGKNANSN